MWWFTEVPRWRACQAGVDGRERSSIFFSLRHHRRRRGRRRHAYVQQARRVYVRGVVRHGEPLSLLIWYVDGWNALGATHVNPCWPVWYQMVLLRIRRTENWLRNQPFCSFEIFLIRVYRFLVISFADLYRVKLWGGYELPRYSQVLHCVVTLLSEYEPSSLYHQIYLGNLWQVRAEF